MDRRYQTAKCLAWLLLSAVAAGGCSSSASTGIPDISASDYLLQEEPDAAKGVLEVRAELGEAAEPAEVAIFGQLRGLDEQTFDPNQAAFVMCDESIVDEIGAHQTSDHDSDNCPFCQAAKRKLLDGLALIRIVDQQGDVPPIDARQFLGLQKDQRVVVSGLAEIDTLGNLVVNARKVYVRRSPEP